MATTAAAADFWAEDEIALAEGLWRDPAVSVAQIMRALREAFGPRRTEGGLRALMVRNRDRFPARSRQPGGDNLRAANIAGKKEGRALDPVYTPPRAGSAEAVAYDAASLHLPLDQLDARQCRFAVNDAAPGEPHLFCGHAVLSGRYCQHHSARAFRGYWSGLKAEAA